MPQSNKDVEGEKSVEKFSKPIERRLAEDHKVVYANNVLVHTSVYDINVDFGQVVESREDVIIVEDKVKVLMSPVHAKALSLILIGAVGSYEQQFGQLPDTIELPFDICISRRSTENRKNEDGEDE